MRKSIKLAAVVGLAGAGLVVADDQGWIGGPTPIEVTAAAAAPATIIEHIDAEGKLQPETDMGIAADVSGEVVGLLVQEGDSVQQGQLLLRIQPDTYQAAAAQRLASVAAQRARAEQAGRELKQLTIDADQALRTFTRQAALFSHGVISRADYEAAEATHQMAQGEVQVRRARLAAAQGTLREAEASYAQACQSLRQTAIYAPVSGVVNKLSVKQGERVVGTGRAVGTELLRLADPRTMLVRVNVGENEISRVKVGDSAQVTLHAFSRARQGIVTAVASVPTQARKESSPVEYEVQVRVLAPRPTSAPAAAPAGESLRPGMTAAVAIVTARRANVLSVPLYAVTTRRKGKATLRAVSLEDFEEARLVPRGEGQTKKEKPQVVVFVVKNDQVVRTPVQVGISDLEHIEITGGLAPGTIVATGPFRAITKALRNHCRVEVKAAADLDKVSEPAQSVVELN